jgi:hypothetical protein
VTSVSPLVDVRGSRSVRRVGNASIVTGEEGVSDGFDPATGATSQIDTLLRARRSTACP